MSTLNEHIVHSAKAIRRSLRSSPHYVINIICEQMATNRKWQRKMCNKSGSSKQVEAHNCVYACWRFEWNNYGRTMTAFVLSHIEPVEVFCACSLFDSSVCSVIRNVMRRGTHR